MSSFDWKKNIEDSINDGFDYNRYNHWNIFCAKGSKCKWIECD